jgi:membrane-bound inhibitor of C-type lysozyme
MGEEGNMLGLKSVVMVLILLTASLPGFASGGEKPALKVQGGKAVTYVCETGDRVTARYYSLSDRSLDFVKVTLPDKTEYTLPQVMSASGVKYSDDFKLVWWTKGETAFMQARDDKGEWKLKFQECKAELPGKK